MRIRICRPEGGEDDGFLEEIFSIMLSTIALTKVIVTTFTQSKLLCTNFATFCDADEAKSTFSYFSCSEQHFTFFTVVF